MKILLAVFITLFSLDTSAQFYTRLFPKKHTSIPTLTLYAIPFKPDSATLVYDTSFRDFHTDLGRSRYSFYAEEALIMKKLKHSARYGQAAMRIEFDNLANFYLSQNRFSEAKWYLLRSNAISRQQKNYAQIINSLLVLAEVKSDLGDYKQANEDLFEARSIAISHKLDADLQLVDQHTKQIQLHKEAGLKVKNRYSDLL